MLFTTGMTTLTARSFKPTVENSQAVVSNATSKILLTSTLKSYSISPSLMINFSPTLLTLPTEQLNTFSLSYFIKEPSSTPLVTPPYGNTSIQTKSGMINQISVTYNESRKPLSFTGVHTETFIHSYTISRVRKTSLVAKVTSNPISCSSSCTSLHGSSVPSVSIPCFTPATCSDQFSARLTSASLSRTPFSQFSGATGLLTSPSLILNRSLASLDKLPTKSHQHHLSTSRLQASYTKSFIVSIPLITSPYRIPFMSGSEPPTRPFQSSVFRNTSSSSFNQPSDVSPFQSESPFSRSLIERSSSTLRYIHASQLSFSSPLPPFASTVAHTSSPSKSRKTFLVSGSSRVLESSYTQYSPPPSFLSTPLFYVSISRPSRFSAFNSSLITTLTQGNHSQSVLSPISFSCFPSTSHQTVPLPSVSSTRAPSLLFSSSYVSSFIPSSWSLTRSLSYPSSFVSFLLQLTSIGTNTLGFSLSSVITSRNIYLTSTHYKRLSAFSISVTTSVKSIVTSLLSSTPSLIWPVNVQSLSPPLPSSTVHSVVVSSSPSLTPSNSVQYTVVQSSSLSFSLRSTQPFIAQSPSPSFSSLQSTFVSRWPPSTSSTFRSVLQSPLPSFPSSSVQSIVISSSTLSILTSSVISVVASSSPHSVSSSFFRSVFFQSSSSSSSSSSVQSFINSSSPGTGSSSSVQSFIGRNSSRPSSSVQYVFASSSLPLVSSSSIQSVILQSPLLPTPSSSVHSYSRRSSPPLILSSFPYPVIFESSSLFTISHSVQSAIGQRSPNYFSSSSVTFFALQSSSLSFSPLSAFISSHFKPSFSVYSLGPSSSWVEHTSIITSILKHSVARWSSFIFSLSSVSYEAPSMSFVSLMATSHAPFISLYPSTSTMFFVSSSVLLFSPTKSADSYYYSSVSLPAYVTSSRHWVLVTADVTKTHSQATLSLPGTRTYLRCLLCVHICHLVVMVSCSQYVVIFVPFVRHTIYFFFLWPFYFSNLFTK